MSRQSGLNSRLEKIRKFNSQAIGILVSQTLSLTEQDTLDSLLGKMVDSVKYTPLEKTTKNRSASIITTLYEQLKIRIREYSENDSPDEVDIGIDLNTKIDIFNEHEVRNYLMRLKDAVVVNNKQTLFVKAELGRVYYQLRRSTPKNEWSATCARMCLCVRTIRRYIQFYKVYCEFPRILISGLTYDQVMSNWKPLLKKLDIDLETRAILQNELKTTSTRLHIHGIPKRETVMSEDEDEDADDGSG